MELVNPNLFYYSLYFSFPIRLKHSSMYRLRICLWNCFLISFDILSANYPLFDGLFEKVFSTFCLIDGVIFGDGLWLVFLFWWLLKMIIPAIGNQFRFGILPHSFSPLPAIHLIYLKVFNRQSAASQAKDIQLCLSNFPLPAIFWCYSPSPSIFFQITYYHRNIWRMIDHLSPSIDRYLIRLDPNMIRKLDSGGKMPNAHKMYENI